MLGNNGGTLTGTFEGYVFEDVRDENSQSEDSVISIIIFYNITWYSKNTYINM